MWTGEHRKRKARRFYHRAMSGLERTGQYRLLTLTSSPTAPRPVSASWRALVARLRRRRLSFDYIWVRERGAKTGMVHLHVLVRGSYMALPMLSSLWAQIHASPVVDIRMVKRGSPLGKKLLAGYLAKYLAKAGERYAWSRGWVWPGFCGTWDRLKRAERRMGQGMAVILATWRGLIRGYDRAGPALRAEFVAWERMRSAWG